MLLSGAVTMAVRKSNSDQPETECITMRTGDTVIIDPTEIHQMQNIGDVVAEYIVFGISSQKGGKTIVVSQDSRLQSGFTKLV